MPGSAPVSGASLRSSVRPQAATDWLESPYLRFVVGRVAYRYHLAVENVPDLLQELRVALWRAGPDLSVNATWVIQTANHKAQDFLRRMRRNAEESSTWSEVCGRSTSRDPELLHLLRARVDQLPNVLRRFYELRFQQGFSQREVAERLGICRSSVRCFERRCLRMVRGRRLSSHGDNTQLPPNAASASRMPEISERRARFVRRQQR
jgi:RNA polymerase sigma factor (sigma-70 family)